MIFVFIKIVAVALISSLFVFIGNKVYKKIFTSRSLISDFIVILIIFPIYGTVLDLLNHNKLSIIIYLFIGLIFGIIYTIINIIKKHISN